MSYFFIEALCIFFAFAAGYYKNMSLFTAVAVAFWLLWLSSYRKEKGPHGTLPGDQPGNCGTHRNPGKC